MTPSTQISRPDLPHPLSLYQPSALENLIHHLDGMAYRGRDDPARRMQFVSRGCLALSGYSAAVLMASDAGWMGVIHKDDRVVVADMLASSLRGNGRFELQYRIRTAGGQIRHVRESGVASGEDGCMVLEGFVMDVTSQQRTIRALAQAEMRYRTIFEHAQEGIFQSSKTGRYLAANPALARLYGYASPEELILNLSDISCQLYVEAGRREAFLHLMATAGEVVNFESEVYRKDGKRIWISENAHVVSSENGCFLYYEGTVQDISERKHYQQQLEMQANFDALTGLPNRALLYDRLRQCVARAARAQSRLAVVFIDLDNFKFINDNLGHAAGDQLLKIVAERIAGSIRKLDTVARLGGDEFVLILNDLDSEAGLATLLERIRLRTSQPVQLQAQSCNVSASLGVALYPRDGLDEQTLLRHADVAMYAAKAAGKDNLHFFTGQLDRQSDERFTLEREMRLALEQDGFSVAYQPKFDRAGQIVGVEALARWQHAQLGNISPDRFIPVAEECGLIQPLTMAILRQACRAVARCNLARTRPISLAVNLSPRLFERDHLCRELASVLADCGFPPQDLELEITESLLLGDTEHIIGQLQALKDWGASLAMDDFGTGYSSLGYLVRFPLDIIKIDRSLVAGIESNEQQRMVVSAVVTLGRNLGKEVVAEGVETPAQLQFLQEMACSQFQGFGLSMPLDEDALRQLLAD
ncbi:putative bifunctional diguanylate cyclase/phosphodiesterase [Aquitalea denitrificans]|uniref:putative bifunctional diguanylate cyclase/phosphodiesterase n=1 Tax=Aquitalea denitrificans TaxID=519081 RepID=UPI0013585614|nr:bifunctional diguanylate cyclase/phosphodiesterase [Aquitalea denitrificans]